MWSVCVLRGVSYQPQQWHSLPLPNRQLESVYSITAANRFERTRKQPIAASSNKPDTQKPNERKKKMFYPFLPCCLLLRFLFPSYERPTCVRHTPNHPPSTYIRLALTPPHPPLS